MRFYRASLLLAVLSVSQGFAEELTPAAQARLSAAIGKDQTSYHAIAQSGGLRLRNPKHGFAAEFTREVVTVRAGSAQWGWSFLGHGYDAPDAAVRVAPHAAANRVEYRRGDLIEWYLNGPLGLEQGFTLAKAPGQSTGAPLTLALDLSGNLTASADGTRNGAVLRRPDGVAVLRYGGLTAFDATGRELPAWLDVDGKRLSLRVNDAGAQYPIVVDPFIQRIKITAADGLATDFFGSPAVDGDTLVVGAPGDDVDGRANQGSAYVFVRPPGGWTEIVTHQARLFAGDGTANDTFGRVAVSGDTIVVGANGCPPPTNCAATPSSKPGAAYVFVRPPGGWSGSLTHQAKLVASDALPNELFGSTVAIDADTVVVSADFDDSLRGAAYVFVRPAAGWSGVLNQNAKLVASDRDGDILGNAAGLARAAIAGDTIVAVAAGMDLQEPTGLLRDAGKGYVFTRPAGGWSGLLTENAQLVASDRITDDRLGNSISMRGDTIVVGAPFASRGALSTGAAYVFRRPLAGWTGRLTEAARLLATDRETNDNLGSSVLLAPGFVVAGAPGADGAAVDSGAAYVFEEPAGGWAGTVSESERLSAEDGATGDAFAGGIANQGDVLFFPASRADIGANVDQGALYVFVANRAAQLTLSPADATNPVGTNHSVTARVEDSVGTAVPNMLIRVSVTGSVSVSDSCMTDADGRCEVSYAGPTTPGTDDITAYADSDEDGTQDEGEPGANATKRWVTAAAASIALAPSSATNPVGSQHCVNATVRDAFGNPVANVIARFSTTGAVATGGSDTTRDDGAAFFCYSGPTAPGADQISAFADANGDGLQNPGEPGATATKTWVAGAAAALALAPEAATNPVNTEHCVVATVSDAFGNRTPGVIVRFTVSGSATASGSAATDADGSVGFCYTGPAVAGEDVIAAFADRDEDGEVDADEPSDSATKSWIAPAAEDLRASGAGIAPGATARGTLAFAFFGRRAQGEVGGSCLVIDAAARVVIVCRDVTALARNGTQATLSGHATLNGEPTTYQIEVDDVADPGRDRDTFRIRTQNGYIAGGLLRFGDVQIQ